MADQPQKKARVDYSQLRRLDHDEAEKVEKQYRELADMIRRCRRDYDLWFNRTMDKPPHDLRSKLDNHVRLMRHKLPKRTADQFRLGTLLQQYQSLVEHWDKSTRAQEEGGVAPWMARTRTSPLDELEEANEERQEQARRPGRANYGAKVSGGDGDDEAVRKVFDSYVAAKKKAGEDVSSANFEKFKRVLAKQTKAIIDSGKGSSVAYRIEVAAGKVSIKAKPQK